ncbi:hypothetical protein K227x_27040 [Rubripirellula lacrimiformis]|uniref:3-keto-disaccharide hydrolase domain-containing protein n=1 Tax=Rubripirellula lacrimiformis TaxID=1930273 RepID=A0A517NB01_9BACT|nr:hypothetical protein K227x_27040 [Rubripirellula lacrimiformis]
MTRFLLAAVGCVCLIHVPLSPASAQSPRTTLQPIFNGANLDGWKHSGN